MNKILFELIKKSNRSDHQIGQITSLSQPTVSRLRDQLEKEKIIKEYTITPDLAKMGYSIMAIFSIKYKAHQKEKAKQMSTDAIINHSSTIFASQAQGMGKNAISISLFKNYGEYAKYMSYVTSKWDCVIDDYSVMLVDLKGPILKPFSLKYLIENRS
jgi:DNA-binding Lrp family transcriptional regulator